MYFMGRKRFKGKLRLGFILAVSILTVPGLVGGRAYLDIDSPTAKRLPIVIPDLKNKGALEPSLGSQSSLLLSKDLDYTGYFQIVDPKTGLGRPDEEPPDFKAWSLTGADLLVTGSYRPDGPQLQMELRLYDLLQGRQLLGREYSLPVRDYKKAVHRFAEEILLLLTGERGLFQTRMAFVSTASGKKEIYVSDFAGDNFSRLTHHASIALSPRWSPKGTEIAFTSYKDGTPALYLLQVPGLNASRISGRPGVNISPAWFPNGESLALATNHNGLSEILHISRTGATLQRISQSWSIDVSPAWSPDGKYLAFVSNRSGNPHIYVLNTATKDVRRLTFQGNYNVSPVWSPKGGMIAYAGRAGGQFQIFVISPQGGDPKQLTFSGNNESPDFSPDGRMIAFSSTRQAGRSAIYVMNVNGANQRRITFMNGEQFSPSWCPRHFDE
jgi:TolB protein